MILHDFDQWFWRHKFMTIIDLLKSQQRLLCDNFNYFKAYCKQRTIFETMIYRDFEQR